MMFFFYKKNTLGCYFKKVTASVPLAQMGTVRAL